ncbi:MAG: winged helix DNA-binding domain-containing protein [Myxococcales bacterium]|nr:winged helix DNA-binding domain-containing protein [Myxococcales bacterium]
MNPSPLVDAIVRQTVILIATLATGAGQRPSLSHLADQVFSELARELKQQGLSTKVVADMFGMALRTYQTRVAQLSVSRSDASRSLWEAVYAHIQTRSPLLRADLHSRFAAEDAAMLRGVIRDLVESGLVEQSGRADATRYTAVAADALLGGQQPAAFERMLLVAAHRHGPATVEELAAQTGASDRARVAAALESLVEQALVNLEPHSEPERYSCERCVIPFGDEQGWEAAVFDHYQAMVAALVTKLRGGNRRADLKDHIGGSTFVFDLHESHPMAGEALGFLEETRARGHELRERIESFDASNPAPSDARPLRVIAYVGQTVAELDPEDDDA